MKIVYLPVAVIVSGDKIYDCWINHEDPPWDISEEIVKAGVEGVTASRWLADQLPFSEVDAEVDFHCRLLPAVLSAELEDGVEGVTDPGGDVEGRGFDVAC